VTFWSSMGPFNAGCWAAGCVGADCCAAIVLVVCFSLCVCCCCHVGCLLLIAGGVLVVFCSCSLLLPCGVSPAYCRREWGKNGGTKNKQTKNMHPVGEANADVKGC
jgi:hypothetical protein